LSRRGFRVRGRTRCRRCAGHGRSLVLCDRTRRLGHSQRL